MNPATRRQLERAARFIAAERQRRMVRLSAEIQDAKRRTLEAERRQKLSTSPPIVDNFSR
jgi:hypothetical protein